MSALPGDDIVGAPTFKATRAITVDAPPEAVWPWITQIGVGRSGWYSYDLLDNLGRHSADTIVASLQDVRVGDLVPFGPGGGGLRVRDLMRGEWLLGLSDDAKCMLGIKQRAESVSRPVQPAPQV